VEVINSVILHSCARLTLHQEACENIIKFPEDDPIAMKALVKHLYGYTTIEVLTGDGKVGISVQWLLGLHDIAQKYTQPQLAASTLSEFERLCSMADSGTHLKQQANWWEHMAKDIYNKASDYDRTLWRQALLRLTWIYSKILIQNEDLIKAVTRDVPGFAAELFLRGGLDGKGIKKA